MTRQQILDKTHKHIETAERILDSYSADDPTYATVSLQAASAHAEVARALCAFHEVMFGGTVRIDQP